MTKYSKKNFLLLMKSQRVANVVVEYYSCVTSLNNVRPGPRFTPGPGPGRVRLLSPGPGPGPGPKNILNSLNLLSMILLSICQVRVSSGISTIMIRRQKSE